MFNQSFNNVYQIHTLSLSLSLTHAHTHTHTHTHTRKVARAMLDPFNLSLGASVADFALQYNNTIFPKSAL